MTELVIFGAGAIGGYLAANLLDAGKDVALFARPERAQKLRSVGLRTTEGLRVADVPVLEDPAALRDAAAVVLTVKSTALQAVVPVLRANLAPGCPVICLLNGLSPAQALADALPDTPITAGMVPFNVFPGDDGLHRSSHGAIAVADTPAGQRFAAMLAPTLCPAQTHANIQAVLAGKLLLNLNNPVNALSGLPLKAQLSQRPFRRVYAAALAEALTVYKAAGIHHVQTAALPVERILRVLRWPDFLFNTLALPRQDLDADSQTSMAQDLAAGRLTEIDTINGDIVSLGAQAGVPTPVNSRLVALIHAAEAGGQKTWDGRELLDTVTRAPDKGV